MYDLEVPLHMDLNSIDTVQWVGHVLRQTCYSGDGGCLGFVSRNRRTIALQVRASQSVGSAAACVVHC